MNKIISIRGMHDLINDQFLYHDDIIKKFVSISKKFNFKPISTPIVESSEVFTRTLGDSSDVVMKEMYSFEDKSGESITLRPEGTAGIARAVINNGLTQELPLKLYYYGPMFRYERPQKGRLRQFHQIGVEIFSNTNYEKDFEVISLASNYLQKLNISNSLSLQINNLGHLNDRLKYTEALKKYYIQKKKNLSKDSIIRLQKNPLRILDSKNLADIEINKNAPLILDFLNDESHKYFNNLKNLLDKSNIKYCENPFLVRGLDYYSNTIFEFTLKDNNKYAVIAGGSYDNLVKDLGGPKLSGTGWASGIERLADLYKLKKKQNSLIIILPLEEKIISKAYEIRNIILREDKTSEVFFTTNLKKSLKYANKIDAAFAIIIGEDEINKSVIRIKNLSSGEQKIINEEHLLENI